MKKYCITLLVFVVCLITWLTVLVQDSYAQAKQNIGVIKGQFIERLSYSVMSQDVISPNSVDLKITEKSSVPSLISKADDAFYIKVNPQKIYIASSSLKGIKNGVFWYLQQLGYRHYFPNEAWQYVPKLSSAYKLVDSTVYASFAYRRIWYAYGTGSSAADQDYRLWVESNLLGGEDVSAGHSYDGIVNRNKSIFLTNPQFFAQQTVAGKIPRNPKFEVGNKVLVDLVINDAIQQIKDIYKKTGVLPEMISMDPSDGGGFSTSAASLKIGGPVEQTFYLANEVAKAVKQKYSTVKVGLYAYNEHAAPPEFPLENNIVVLIATAMNQSKYRTGDLIALWKKKGVQIGIRDYYGVMAWDWDMPGRPNGSRLTYVNKLKDYYKGGLQLFSAETNIGWISRGLGHYMASRLLWNANENPEQIKDEFFKTMFGKAEKPMRALYESWQNTTTLIPEDRELKNWVALVNDAASLEPDNRIQVRLQQVMHYLHYVFLFKKWRSDNTKSNLFDLFSYVYRIQDEGSVASYPLIRRLANDDEAKKDAAMSFKNSNAVWKSNTEKVSAGEIRKLLDLDISSAKGNKNDVNELQLPKRFSSVDNGLNTRKTTSPEVKLRGTHYVILNINDNNASINLSSGLIKAKNFKSLELLIYPYNEGLSINSNNPVFAKTIEPKQPLQSISLNKLGLGTYIAKIDDARAGFSLSVTGNISFAIMADATKRLWSTGRNNFYFIVNDVSQFAIHNDGVLTLVSPAGRQIDLQSKKGETLIDVKHGENGIWKISNQSGVFNLKGVIPFVSSAKTSLLQTGD
ncbi:MAG: DUF4838 domain-containing protein [Ginsengibacter sp.]